ncbi:MAG: phosphoribosylglycinamide formyltransferase [Candidatus Adiutrix sp.]|jgi:phosphoribosylglycinamide formyltransferase-1|nr:phosphoribosylglycinamide formyltransferase [Candidatus Adiutrix sp.]
MTGPPLALGVLVSGRGSNLAAILDQIKAGRLAAQVRVVISDQPNAPALRLAADQAIPALAIQRRSFANQESFEARVAAELEQRGVELVVLAGFMRLIGPTLIDRFPGRIINVHPALLPSFPGLAAQQQALAHGVKISGCTVHFVNEVMDGGRIIAQTAVPLLEGDTVESLSARILAEEHQLLPLVIGRLAEQIRAEQVSEDGSSQG